MRVAMYYSNNDVRLEKLPTPQINADELLIKVVASGICGSDVMEWYRIKKAPLVLGHEIAGEVVEVGENVKKYSVGERVFVFHHIPCNTCNYCLRGHYTACETLHTTNYYPGGFAEYVRVPALNVDRGVFLLPDEISFEEGTFIEPLACVIHGQKVARLKPGQSVLVLGSGISGLLHILVARSLGAGRIIATDVDENRLRIAREFGADVTINAHDNVATCLKSSNKNSLAEVVIVCTGAMPAFLQALQSVERGGIVLFFAPTDPDAELPVPVNKFWRNEITLTTSYGNAPSDALVAIDLLQAGRIPVHKMITHRLGLAETGLGFQLVAKAKESIKVIIEPHK
ncbi:MAG: zinc-dependent dehydrogenase [bacterium]